MDEIVAAKPVGTPGLFIRPGAQLELVQKWNHDCRWGFTDGDFTGLGAAPEYSAGASPPTTGILEVSLGTVEQTFEQAWQLAVDAQEGRHWRWDQVKSDTEHLRLLPGTTHQRGLRWRIVDLAANWDRKDGIRPKHVRNPQKSPHSAILWAAAFFPKWIQAMDGTTVPYVWIPGYEACVSGYQSWSNVPRLIFGRGDRQVKLYADHCSVRLLGWALPEFL